MSDCSEEGVYVAYKQTVCVITGTRAEYGLLYWLMKEIDNDPDLQLQLVVTGMHLAPEFGMTCQQIEQDGFQISEKVEMLLSSDTPIGIAKSIGLGVIGFADTFSRLKPDIVVILGDRYEILAAAQAAMVARIPMAHIHGGELTEGAMDEAIRHALTKMSHLHFVAAEPYRRRVIQLGEQPDRVFHVGALGLDHIKRLKLLSRQAFEQSIDFKLGTLNFLVTYHPTTLNKEDSGLEIIELFRALDQYQDAHIIFTKANSDMNGRMINSMIDEYVKQNIERMIVFTSLGQLRYLSALQYVDVVIGNSSSGLIEAPLFGKPTVNIGDRQRGRLKAGSVIDCEETSVSITSAIEYALSEDFQKELANIVSLYGQGSASILIKEELKKVDLNEIIKKKFYDLDLM